MSGWSVIGIRIVDQSPPCRLCGTPKIEWSHGGDAWAWLCFNCDVNEDDDEEADED